LANLNLRNPVERRYAALLARVFPRPDVAFLLDADPVQARSRKPEYPLRFLRRNRAAYLDLADATGHLSGVPPLPVSPMTGYVMNKVAQTCHRPSSGDGIRSRSGMPQLPITATNK
jgi:hypothetical protein